MISRIFRGENENAAIKRRRQIDTLKIFNDNVIELREDVEYQVEFEAGNKRMAIVVSLSPEFPLERPVLRVSPPVTHPWCNEHSEITGAPGLLNFPVHSDLGRVVQAIIREFTKNPPQPQETSLPCNMPHRDIQEGVAPAFGLHSVYPELQSVSSSSYTSYNSQYPQYSSAGSSLYKFNYGNSSISDPSYRTPFANSPTVMHNVSPGLYSPDRRVIGYANSFNSGYNSSLISESVHPTLVDFPELNRPLYKADEFLGLQ